MSATAAPAARPRRRWGRRLLVLLVLLLVAVALAPLALALPFVRDALAAQASRALGLPVKIEKASAFWTSGVDLEGIRVESPEGFDEPLATVRSVHVDVSLLALLSGTVEASATVVSPWITLVEDASGRRNGDPIFRAREPKPPEPKEPSSSRLRLTLAVQDGLVRSKRPGAPTQEIRDLDVSLRMGASGDLAATLRALAKEAGENGSDVAIEADASLPAAGRGPVRVKVPPLDLARLSGLLGGVTGLEDLAGRVAIDVDGKAALDGSFGGRVAARAERLALGLEDGTRLSIRELDLRADLTSDTPRPAGDVVLTIRDLALAPGPVATGGYAEPEIVVKVHAGQAEGSEDVVVRLTEARSALLRVTDVQGEAPLTITMGPETSHVEGLAQVVLDLAALGRAAGGKLGLEAQDRMGGTLTLVTRLDLTDGAGQANASLATSRVVLPASWGAEGLPPADVSAKANVRIAPEATEVDVPALKGFGLEGRARAVARGGDLAEAHAELQGELADARALLAPLLGLERGAALTGRLALLLDVSPVESGRRLKAEATIAAARWRDATGETLVDEPQVKVVADVLAPPASDGTLTIDRLRLEAGALTADVTGRATRRGEATDVDLGLALDGDAGRLAPALTRFLGPDWQDLQGRGPIRGNVALQGPLAEGGTGLRANGRLTPGSWATGGLTLETPSLELRRPASSDPQALAVRSGVNGGTLALDLELRRGAQATPWSTKLDLQGIDTAPLVTSQGLGRYLTYLLPTLLPGDAAARVLTGRLDAKAALEAADLGGDVLADTLRGQGEIRMVDGAIGQSTLFRTVGGGGLGEVGKVLAATVPEVGREIDGLARALAFRRIESVFQVAERVVRVDPGRLEGERVLIAFRGTVGFDEKVDLEVAVTLLGTTGERLKRVLPSATIPLAVKGTLASPRVAPGLQAKDLATGALERLLPGGGEKNPLDRLKDLLPR